MIFAKERIRYFLYKTINWLSTFTKSKNVIQNSLLIIRLDAIGDYILFRNFIKALKESDKFKDYKITLCGNIAWKEIAEAFDKEYIDEFIWIDRRKFERDLICRYKKLREITNTGYEVAIHPTYSREFYYGDTIINLVTAKEKIGSIGDWSNIAKWQKRISDTYYTKLIPAKEEILFEFYRNKEFLENFLGQTIDIRKPTLAPVPCELQLPKKYAVLFIGASAEGRKWPMEYFAKAGEYLRDRYHLEIVICGGLDDGHPEEIRMKFGKKVHNLIGKTTLVELCWVIRNATILFSNETSAPHLAAAMDVPVVVIYNGNYFGRFTPYPEEMTNKYIAVYHPEIEKNLENYRRLSNRLGYASDLDIKDIPLERVIRALDERLANGKS